MGSAENCKQELTLAVNSDSEIETEGEPQMDIKAHSVLVDEPDLEGDGNPENKNSEEQDSPIGESKTLEWTTKEEMTLLSAVLDGIYSAQHRVYSVVNAVSSKVCPNYWNDVAKKIMTETGKIIGCCDAYQKFRNVSAMFFVRRRSKEPWNEKEMEVFSLTDMIFRTAGKESIAFSGRNEQGSPNEEGNGNAGKPPSLKGRLKWASNLSYSYLCADCIRNKNSDENLQGDLINIATPQANINATIDCEIPHPRSEKSTSVADFNPRSITRKRLNWDHKAQFVLASIVLDGLQAGSHGVSTARDVTCFGTYSSFWGEVAVKMQEKTGKCASPQKFHMKFRLLKKYFLQRRKGYQPNVHERELFGILEQIFGANRRWHSRGTLTETSKQKKVDGTFDIESAPSAVENLNALADRHALLPNSPPSSLSTPSGCITRSTRRAKKLKWSLKDEIHLANAVKDCYYSGVDNVESLRDVLSFRRHGGFWSVIKSKLHGLIDRPLPAVKLYSKFYNMKMRYMNGKKIRRSHSEHDDMQLYHIFNEIHRRPQKQTAYATLEAQRSIPRTVSLGYDEAHTDKDKVKTLERKLRKSQLMQELYKIEQEELEEQILTAKSTASLEAEGQG